MIVGSAMGGIFGPGTLLQVHGLVETPELNGKLGKIQKKWRATVGGFAMWCVAFRHAQQPPIDEGRTARMRCRSVRGSPWPHTKIGI